MKVFEYVPFFEEAKPSKEMIQETLVDESLWNMVVSSEEALRYVAREILEHKHDKWDMQADEFIFILIREEGSLEWELHKVTLQYTPYVSTERVSYE